MFATLGEDGSYSLTGAGYTLLVVILLAVFLLGVFIFGRSKRKSSAKQMAFSAMAIALAVVTSMIKFLHLPMGGSITLFSMLFICLVGWFYGLGSGLTAAFAYGILQLIIDPYILSLPQMLTDYVFAFTALGLSGVFYKSKNGLLKGYILGVAGRYFFAVLSGVIFFGTYAADAGFSSPVLYSLAYNGIYLGVEAALTIVVILIPPVKKALVRIKQTATDMDTAA